MDELEAKVRCLEVAARIAFNGDNPVETIATVARRLYDSLQAAPIKGTLHVKRKEEAQT